MFKKIVLLAVLSGVISVSGAITTGAQAAAPSSDPTTIFNLSRLNDTYRALAIDALDGFDYDWTQMKAALKAKTGRNRIPIKIVDIDARWNACGLSWPHGVIHVDDQVIAPVWFQQVVQHEVGHMVDFFHLRPENLHDQIAEIYDAPWSVMNHNFNTGFIQVFSDTLAVDATYPMTDV